MIRYFKAVLIDLSGTLHIENELISGSVEALNKLLLIAFIYKKIFLNGLLRLRLINDLKLRFVTNTTKESKFQLHKLLVNLGFSIDINEIFSSLSAARRLILDKNLRPMMFLEDGASQDFEDISKDDPNCVLIGLAPNMFNYNDMNKAFRYIFRISSLHNPF